MFRKSPNRWTLTSLCAQLHSNEQQQFSDGRWGPSQPIGFWSWKHRLALAVAVLKGEADALFWEL